MFHEVTDLYLAKLERTEVFNHELLILHLSHYHSVQDVGICIFQIENQAFYFAFDPTSACNLLFDLTQEQGILFTISIF